MTEQPAQPEQRVDPPAGNGRGLARLPGARRRGRVPGGRLHHPVGRPARRAGALAALVVAAWFVVSRRGTARLVAAGAAVAAWCSSSSSWWPATACGCSWWGCSWPGCRPARPEALRPPSVGPDQVVAAAATRSRGADHEPVVRGREGREVRARAALQRARHRADRARQGRRPARARRGRRGAWRRRHRHGGRRRLAGARRVGGEPARHPDGGDPGGHAQPLRARPGHRPRRRRRRAGGLRRRHRAADRPGRGQRTGLREQLLHGALREDRAVAGLPRRQGAHGRRDAARPDRPERRALDLRFALPRGAGSPRPTCVLVSNNPYQLRTCGGRHQAPARRRSARRRLGPGARRRGCREAGRARGRRAGVAVRRVERVGGDRVRGDLRGAGRGWRRRRGPADGVAAAVRDPARGPDHPPASCGALGAGRPPRPCTWCRPRPSARCGRPPSGSRCRRHERRRRRAGRPAPSHPGDPGDAGVEPAEERLARRLDERAARGTPWPPGPPVCCTASGPWTAPSTSPWPGCRRRPSTCR